LIITSLSTVKLGVFYVSFFYYYFSIIIFLSALSLSGFNLLMKPIFVMENLLSAPRVKKKFDFHIVLFTKN